MMCLCANEWAVSTCTLVRPRTLNFCMASSLTDLLNARYKIRAVFGLAMAYAVRVLVFPEPATALIFILPSECMIAFCSLVNCITESFGVVLYTSVSGLDFFNCLPSEKKPAHHIN